MSKDNRDGSERPLHPLMSKMEEQLRAGKCDRREFLRASGAGLVVLCLLGRGAEAQDPRRGEGVG